MNISRIRAPGPQRRSPKFMPTTSKGVDILGVQVTPIGMTGVLNEIQRWIKTRQRHYVCACPNYSIMMSQQDVKFREALSGAGIVTADGKAVVWACKFLGGKDVQQVRGADLTRQTCRMAAERGYSVFFYGGTEGIPEKLAAVLAQAYPGLRIVGCYSPPFRSLSQSESEQIVKMINGANPDIVWVGLGAPKQEIWMADHLNKLSAPVVIGVGAAFDFIAGKTPEAPRWMQKAGIEWLFRLMKDPKRLWKRNLYHPVFLAKVLMQKCFGYRSPTQ